MRQRTRWATAGSASLATTHTGHKLKSKPSKRAIYFKLKRRGSSTDACGFDPIGIHHALIAYLMGNEKPLNNLLKACLIATTLANIGYAQAQKIPYDSKLDPAIQEELFRVLREKLQDASSAIIIGIRPGQHGAICGLITAKTARGEYTGYKPFAFDPEKRRLATEAMAYGLDLHDAHFQQKLLAIQEAVRWMAAACPPSEGK